MMRTSTRTRIVLGSGVATGVGVALALVVATGFQDPPSAVSSGSRGALGDVASEFMEGVPCGTLDNQELREVSGIAASARYPDMFWVHNDSGEDSGRIFLIDDTGRHRATVNLVGIDNRDWEGIAVGPGPDPNSSYIYVGDTGDNKERYETHFVHRLTEPAITFPDTEAATVAVDSGVETLRYRYDNGRPDAEAFMIDPWTAELYIISKNSSHADVYSLRYPESLDTTVTAHHLERLPYSEVVAADISPDGDEIIVKNYKTVFLWERNRGESVEDALLGEPALPPYDPEPQGEAIAFAHDGKGFYTLSESPGSKEHDLTMAALMFHQKRS
jgi:hypothetical protein